MEWIIGQKMRSIIQVDMEFRSYWIYKKSKSVGICGDAKLVSQQIIRTTYHQQQVIQIDKKEKI